jgi:hypothetical protein
MATATGSRQPRRRNGDQLTAMAKIQKHQTKEILPPKSKSALKNKNNTGLQSPFLLTRLVHFLAAIWHNLSPPDIVAPHGLVKLSRLGAVQMLMGSGRIETRQVNHPEIRCNDPVWTVSLAQRRHELGADLTKNSCD